MCTTERTKKLIVGLALVALARYLFYIVTQVKYHRYYSDDIFVHPLIVFFIISLEEFFIVVWSVVLPVAVLVINALLIREVRRATTSHNAAAHHGLQQQQQSHSDVPTVMLVATSLCYVLLLGTASVLYLAYRWTAKSLLARCAAVAEYLSYFVYAYNFYVYLITGKQFRSDLRELFCRCFSSSSSSSSAAAAAAVYDRDDVRLARRGQLADSAV